jgi:hypothetical protein
MTSIITILADDAIAALKAAGIAVESFVLPEGQKLVAQAKQTTLGTLALNLIQVFENHDLDGAAKMTAVVAALVQAIEKFVAGGGLPGLVTSVEDFALEFGQSVFNDFKADIANVVAPAVAQAA